MRIGILTHHWVCNFGANLQALATQSALRAMGHEPVFINYRNKQLLERQKKLVSPEQQIIHAKFVDQYLTESHLITTSREVENYCLDKLDVILVGSDAMFALAPKYDPYSIWRKLRIPNFTPDEELPPYWLNWERKPRKKIFKASISASSMGTNYHFIIGSLRKELKKAIHGFNYLTVRDDWTKSMLQHITPERRDVKLTPDPVFALNQYFDIPTNEKPPADVSKTILISGGLNEKWISRFVDVAHKMNYTVANLPTPQNAYKYDSIDFHIQLPLSPLQWYALLNNAAGFVGINFHPLVSCIANGTPVLNLDPHKRSGLIKKSSKMFDLCRRAGIPERFYTSTRINKVAPDLILQQLFAPNGMNNAEKYAHQASRQFTDNLKNIIEKAENYLS